MKTIARITNAYPNSGVGSRAYEIAQRMPNTTDFVFEDILLDGITRGLYINKDITRAISKWPLALGSKSIAWIRLARLLKAYDGYDLTNQSISFIARTRQPSIVTVHDIIELTHPQSKQGALVNKYLQSGITNAKYIIAVSDYTKRQLQEYVRYPEDRITVIPNGVSSAFHPVKDFSTTDTYKNLREELQLSERGPFILFVGSEHPRKNLLAVLQVVANLKKEFPTITLIKVGAPGLSSGRNSTLLQIERLHLHENVLFLEDVAEEQLINLYRFSDVLLSPSTLEGFGMTPLQAMACGTPVVCSNTTSLPEVVGDAALTCDPDDTDALANHARSILQNKELAASLVQKGLERAKQFSWDSAAAATLEVYKRAFL